MKEKMAKEPELDDFMKTFHELIRRISKCEKQTGQKGGTIECPVCGAKFNFTRSSYNNHLHGACEKCDLSVFE